MKGNILSWWRYRNELKRAKHQTCVASLS